MSGYVIDLSDEAASVVEALATGKGLTFEDVMKKFKLSKTTADQMLRWLRRSSNNLHFRRRGGMIQVTYKPLTPEIQVMLAEKSAVKKNGNGKTSGGASVVSPSATSNGKSSGGASDIIWAKAPAIPDLDEEYPWYVKMPFHDRLRGHLLLDGHNIRMPGPPGGGKTTATQVIAAQEGIPLVNIPGESGLRYRDLIGHMSDLGIFEVAEFGTAAVMGWWVNIDEANAIEASAALALNSTIAPPKRIVINGKSYPVSNSFRLVITYNNGLAGTSILPDSLKNRMYPIQVPFPSEALMYKMLKANGVDTDDQRVKNLIAFGMLVHAKNVARETTFQITPRDLMYVWSDLKKGMDLPQAIKVALIEGIDKPTEATTINNLMVGAAKYWH